MASDISGGRDFCRMPTLRSAAMAKQLRRRATPRTAHYRDRNEIPHSMPYSWSAPALDRGFEALINPARPHLRQRSPQPTQKKPPPRNPADGPLPRPKRNPAQHAEFAVGARARLRLRGADQPGATPSAPTPALPTQRKPPPPDPVEDTLPRPKRNPTQHTEFAVGGRARLRLRGADQPGATPSAPAPPLPWQNNAATARPLRRRVTTAETKLRKEWRPRGRCPRSTIVSRAKSAFRGPIRIPAAAVWQKRLRRHPELASPLYLS